MGTKIVLFGSFLFSSLRLEVTGSLQIETGFHVVTLLNNRPNNTNCLHVVIQMRAKLVFVIADFFDSNSLERTNFDISSTPRFYSKEVVVL